MSTQTFHCALGANRFLGMRKTRSGRTEIIYDEDGARMVWQVVPDASEGQIGDALRLAVDQPRVVSALYSELRKRSISIEAVRG